ncbi:Inositol hexakisphosphate kinase 1 [Zalerion maritima]|uniref:Kinase n=1 Tax=Zalerion maritima TaxID=339359 RepID=A0AAD5WNI1_9PEZI|nr:Inositol hexakisphosphate kinase 1 [Zalerion maritima]
MIWSKGVRPPFSIPALLLRDSGAQESMIHAAHTPTCFLQRHPPHPRSRHHLTPTPSIPPLVLPKRPPAATRITASTLANPSPDVALMSSPSRSSENAATVAPMSPVPSQSAGDCNGDVVGRGASTPPSQTPLPADAHSPAQDMPHPNSPSLPPNSHNGTSDSAVPLPDPFADVAGSPSTPAPVTTHGDCQLPSVSLVSAPHATSTIAKEQSNSKTSRVLPARHRSGGGPSLLTQGLAKARGIPALKDSPPSQSQTQQQNSDIKHSTSSSTSTPKQSSISPSHTIAQESSPIGTTSTRTTATTKNDGDTVTSNHSSPAMASPATMAAIPRATPSTPTREPIMIPQYSFGISGNVDVLVRNHRELLNSGRGRGTSLERTDRERRLHDQQPDLFSNDYTHNPGDTALPRGPASDDSNSSDQDNNAEPRARYRLWRGGDMVPEKIWSIGNEESDENLDGQVEKSITEVLAGVEHNPRSRKASHSLRFFKEGLPQDKSKRRDSRPGAHSAKNKLPPHSEEHNPSETPVPHLGTSTAIAHSPRQYDAPAPALSRARSFPSEPILTESPLTDYFNASWQAWHMTPRPPQMSPEEKDESIVTKHHVAQKPCDGTGSGIKEQEAPKGSVTKDDENEVDGDDSGEEKVSSALFLPHQAADNDEVRDPTTPMSSHHPHVISAKSRAHSKVEDYHPWLVRTDEPEPDERAAEQESSKPPVFILDPNHTLVYERGEDVAVEDDHEGVPPGRQLISRPPSQVFDDPLHEQMAAKQPLDAIELIPYKHQVGGHTTIWRFSRRAVCKKLNNRENEFYETIERYHRDLLPFLPRKETPLTVAINVPALPAFLSSPSLWYIGVLNVTYQKQPRRKSVVKREEGAAASSQKNSNGTAATAASRATPSNGTDGDGKTSAEADQDGRRVISQSLQSTQVQVPTVTFVDNQHILPRHLLQPTSHASSSSLPRSFFNFDQKLKSSNLGRESHTNGGGERDRSSSNPPSSKSDVRPKLEGHHATSWGTTTVNKRLQHQVFSDAFLRQPVTVEKHKKGHQRPIPRPKLPGVLRPATSDPTLTKTRLRDGDVGAFHARSSPLKPQPAAKDAEIIDASAEADVDDVTGTSAPEPEIPMENLDRKKRRFSGTGLRRKPTDVSEDRGNLKYFQDPDDMDNQNTPTVSTSKDTSRVASPLIASRQEANTSGHSESSQAPPHDPSALHSALVGPAMEFQKIPRPPNPKEARAQQGSRVEYFLLIEDLTSGMKKPCVMDLKMGTRQYGIEATPKKQQSQKRKCAETTSRSLGVRVCGLQVWDVKAKSYFFRDKYFGRQIKEGEEFQEALTRFLYDGVDLHSILRHIPTILQKLEQLEIIVGRLRSYRFYAASLLIHYDGDTSVDGYETNIDDSTTDIATDNEEARIRKKPRKRPIDFKIADFANSVIAADSVKDKPCPPRFPNDPDHGFLKGLRNLRRYFLKIQRDVRTELGLLPHGVSGHQQYSTVINKDDAELSD